MYNLKRELAKLIIFRGLVYLSGFAKNMATEISLIYSLTEPCSGACIFFFHSYFLFI